MELDQENFKSELFKNLVDNGNDFVIVTDQKLIVQYVNKSFISNLAYSNQNILSHTIKEIIPEEYHDVLIKALSEENLITSTKDFELQFRKKSGSRIDIGLNVTLSKYQNQQFYIFDCRDISERKEQYYQLQNAKSLLKGITSATEALLVSSDLNNALQKIVDIIGESFSVDRSYLFQNYIQNGELYTSQKFEWTGESITSQIDNPELQNVKLQDFGLIAEQLSKREFFQTNLTQLKKNDPLFKLLDSQNIKSVLLFPIFVSQDFWGFIGLDNCNTNRAWSYEETLILQGLASNIQIAIEKNDRKKAIQKVASLSLDHPNPIIRMDLEGNIILQNTAAKNLSQPEVSEGILSKKTEFLAAISQQIKKENKEFEFELRDGRNYYQVNVLPVIEQAYINLYFVNITEQKIAERTITKATQDLSLFKTLIDFSSDAVQVAKANGQMFYINHEASKRLSIKPEKVKNYMVKDFEKIFENIGAWEEHVKELKGVEYLTIEGQNTNLTDGTSFPVEVTAKYIELGGEGYVIGNSRDISDRKERENQLKKQESKYRNIISNMNLGLLEVDEADRILYCNKSFSLMSGYELDEIKGKVASEIFLSEENIAFMQSKNEERLDEKADSYEILTNIKGGEKRWWLISGAPNYDDKGNIIGSIGIHLDITEEKETKLNLDNEKQRLDYVIRGTNLGTWEWSIKDGVQLINKRYAEILGYEEDELNPLKFNTWWNLIHSEDILKEHNNLEKHFNGETEFYEAELRLRHKNGSWVWVLKRGKVLSFENGEPSFMYGTLQEISQFKELEEALKFNVEKFQSIYDLSPIGIALNDFNTGDFIDVNNALVEPSGYTKDEFVQLSYYDLTPKEYAKQEEEQLISLKLDKKYGPYEKEYIKKDGTRYPVILNGILFKDLKGNELILSVIQDVTEIKKSEKQKKNQLDALRALNEINAITDTSYSLQISEALKLGAEFLGMEMAIISKIDLATKNYLVVHSYSKNGGLSNGMEFSLKDTYCDITLDANELVAIEHMKESKYNSHSCYSAFNLESYIGIPIYFDKVLYGTLNFSSSLPKGRSFYESELEFIRLLAKWVNSVLERHNFIKFLELSREKAEEAGKAKESFLTNMSHEIRTPLNGIIGMIRELKKAELDLIHKDYLSRASSASDHLLEVVNNILDIAKIESNELRLELINFSLPQLLEDAISILYDAAKENNNQLQLKIENEIGAYYKGDASRIRQVLLNLLGNSIKFTSNGVISLSARLVASNDKKDEIKIIVKDTGIGIDQDYIGKIFQKFQQEDVSISRKFGGTGLGMVITKEIIELMGGSIRIQSKKGEGTEVIIDLALPRVKPDDQNLIADYKLLNFTDQKLELNAKVLLVEDNEMNRLVASNSLNRLKIDITEANNGAEAIDILKEQKFDLILMDIQMPVMDGFEACRIIREDLKLETPIIALSANAFKSEIDQSKKLGMNDYITKPYNENEFIFKVVKYITGNTSSLSNMPIINSTDGKKETDLENEDQREDLYDLSTLEEMSRGNKDFYDKMITIFINSVTEAEKETASFNLPDDYPKLAKLAHRMKPSILNLNINSIISEVYFLEKIEQDTDISTVSDSLKRFMDTIKLVKFDLKTNHKK